MRVIICLLLVALVSGFNPKRVLPKAVVSSIVSFSILYGPVFVNNEQIQSTSNLVLTNPLQIQVANADFRAQQKRTYFRFIPKLEKGRDFYKNELKKAIDSEDWAVVSKFFEE